MNKYVSLFYFTVLTKCLLKNPFIRSAVENSFSILIHFQVNPYLRDLTSCSKLTWRWGFCFLNYRILFGQRFTGRRQDQIVFSRDHIMSGLHPVKESNRRNHLVGFQLVIARAASGEWLWCVGGCIRRVCFFLLWIFIAQVKGGNASLLKQRALLGIEYLKNSNVNYLKQISKFELLWIYIFCQN